MSGDQSSLPPKDLKEDFEDFFEQSMCGFVITDATGNIERVNRFFCKWVGQSPGALKGARFIDLLSVGGKIYFETHLRPLLRMQGFFNEVLLELPDSSGKKVRVLINALERRDENGAPLFTRFVIIKADDRLAYEQNLRTAKEVAEQNLELEKNMVALREQLIAVLGHDLRNPLSAIKMSAELLSMTIKDEHAEKIIATMLRSSSRMMELVTNVMDFARTRLGEGIVLDKKETSLVPFLEQVVAEIQVSNPHKKISAEFNLPSKIVCDPFRIAQVISNLLANAVVHGSENTPVKLLAGMDGGQVEIEVTNNGKPIPAAMQENIFAPFTREAGKPGQQGLGLGLYISSEIARAHGGSLRLISDIEKTTFTLRF